MVAASFSASASWPPRTVTVCGVFQVPVANVSAAGEAVTSGSESELVPTPTVTVSVGCEVSTTV